MVQNMNYFYFQFVNQLFSLNSRTAVSLRASSPIWASETSLVRLASLAQIGELARRLNRTMYCSSFNDWYFTDITSNCSPSVSY